MFYGVFFMVASTAQAAWSILVLLRASRLRILAGAIGNGVVIALFIGSRIVGIPFGPEAFRPEELSGLGIAASASELGLVVLALYVARVLFPGAIQPRRGRLRRVI